MTEEPREPAIGTGAPEGQIPRACLAVLGLAFFGIYLALGLRDPVVHLADFFSHVGIAHEMGRSEPAKITNAFWPAGYPLLLKGVWALTGSPVVAARLIGAGFAALALVAVALIARDVTGDAVLAFIVAVCCGMAPPFAQWAPAEGTDIPCVAMLLVSAALLTGRRPRVLLAGAAAGLAYDFRYAAQVPALAQGVWLLAVGAGGARPRWKQAGLYALAFVAAASPQLALTWWAYGTPFRSFMAKNVWFGIYGDANWQEHWGDVPDEIGLLEVIRLGPARFFQHWAGGFAGLLVGSFVFPKTMLGYGTHALLPLGLIHAAWRLRGAAGLVYFTAAAYLGALAMAFLGPRYFLPLVAPLMLSVWWFLRDSVPREVQAWGRPVPARAIALAAALVVKAALDLNAMVALPASSRRVLAVDDALRHSGMSDPPQVLTSSGDYYDLWTLGRYVRWESAFPEPVKDLGELVSLMRRKKLRFVIYDDFYGKTKTLGHLSWLLDSPASRQGPLVKILRVDGDVPAAVYRLEDAAP
ncbi:MAG: glycosyltransferase family 39 protein [Candidatus Wallbacteria bacterium]|nr:glycosyltransferase family 39 protein [Candidatus Wallbacteria bacterium]